MGVGDNTGGIGARHNLMKGTAMRTSLVSVGAVLLLMGCRMITGVESERVIGEIGYPDQVEIKVPEVVQVGEPFGLTVQTYGNACYSLDGTAVTVAGLSATVTPYDRKRDGYCPQAPVQIAHTATLTFAEPGLAKIHINGRDGTAERSVLVE